LGLFEEPFRIVPRLKWLEKETWGHRKKKIATALITSLIMVVFIMPMAGLSQADEQRPEYKRLYASVTYPLVSEEAQAAMVEAERRLESTPGDFAAAREPLIDFLEISAPGAVPLVVYVTLAQLWYVDEADDRHLEEANRIYEEANAAFPGNENVLLNCAITSNELGENDNAALFFEEYYDVSESRDIKYLRYAAAAAFGGQSEDYLQEAKRLTARTIDESDIPEPRDLNTFIDLSNYLGDFDAAEEYARLALSYYPSEEKYVKIVANAYFDRGDDMSGNTILEEAGLSKSAVASPPMVADTLYNENGNLDTNPVEYDSAKTKFELSEVDTPPGVLKAFPPSYPSTAKLENIEGRVVLRFVVDTDGKAKEPEVVESEPEGVFEESAMKAVGQYEFEPATLDREQVACIVTMPIAYKVASLFPE
jgi:TonB family protein